MMTPRNARRKLGGSRSTRRRNTKTRVMPGGKGSTSKGKQFIGPKFRTRRASQGKPSLAARVRAMREGRTV